MDSEVVRSQVRDENHEPQPQNVGSPEEEQQSDMEKKSVMNKVKAKAKKIKETIKKHGQYVLDHAHDNNSEDHYPPHHDMAEDEQVDGAPVVESEAVKSVPPTLEQVEDFVKTATPALGQGEKIDELGINSGGDTTTVKEEEQPHQKSRDVVGASPTTETNQNIATEPTETFDEEKKPEQHFNVNLEKPTGWHDEDLRTPENEPEAFTPTNYQTKVTDSTETGNDELNITPVEKSFERMNVQDETEQVPEPKVIQYSAEARYPSDGKLGEFVPKPEPEELTSETKTQNPSEGINEKIMPEITAENETETETQYPSGESHDQFATSAYSNTENPQVTDKPLNNTTESAEKPSNQNTYTDKISSATSAIADKAVSAKNVVASKIGYGEKGDRDNKTETLEGEKIEDGANKSGSTLEYGKNIANTVTEKLAPVYGKVAEVGSVAKSKVSGTKTGDGDSTDVVGVEKAESVGKEQEKGASVKDYLAEKLKPGEEDKALSEVISEVIYKPKKEEPKSACENEDAINEKPETVSEESNVNSPGKSVVGKIKGVVGSWFGNKSEENQSSQVAGGEDLLKNKSAGVEVEQISQAEDERRLQ